METGVIKEHMSGYIKSTMNLIPGSIQASTDVSKLKAGLISFSSILKQNFVMKNLSIEELLSKDSFTSFLPHVRVFKEIGIENQSQFSLFNGQKDIIEEFVKEFESKVKINFIQKSTLKRMFEVLGQNDNDTTTVRNVTIDLLGDFSLFIGRLQPVCMQLLDDEVKITKPIDDNQKMDIEEINF